MGQAIPEDAGPSILADFGARAPPERYQGTPPLPAAACASAVVMLMIGSSVIPEGNTTQFSRKLAHLSIQAH